MQMKKLAIFMPILVVLLLLFSSQVQAVEPATAKPRVVILPFELNAPSDLAYLKAGVEAMLASRLSARGGVAVVDQHSIRKVMEETGSVVPTVVGPALKAELVLSGSITSLGQVISLDVRAVRIKGEPAEERFYATADGPDEVIAAVDQLVVDISGRMFKGGVKGSGSEALPATAGATTLKPEKEAAATQENEPELSLHPDRIFRDQPPAATAPVLVPPVTPSLPTSVAAGTPVGQPKDGMTAISNRLLMINRSQSLDYEIQALDVGDLFGDGSAVLVVAEEHHIHVYRQDGAKLLPAGDLPDPPGYCRVVEVNLADLNGNGKAEIYISTISGNSPLSYAVEWNGQAFATLFDKQPWHLRPIDLPGRGQVLAGQEGAANTPVREGIYLLTLQDGQLRAGEKLPLPPQVNLFEFVMADFNGDGQAEVATVDKDGDLFLYGADGVVLWRGTEKYAYTVRYIGQANGSTNRRQGQPQRAGAVDRQGRQWRRTPGSGRDEESLRFFFAAQDHRQLYRRHGPVPGLERHFLCRGLGQRRDRQLSGLLPTGAGAKRLGRRPLPGADHQEIWPAGAELSKRGGHLSAGGSDAKTTIGCGIYYTFSSAFCLGLPEAAMLTF